VDLACAIKMSGIPGYDIVLRWRLRVYLQITQCRELSTEVTWPVVHEASYRGVVVMDTQPSLNMHDKQKTIHPHSISHYTQSQLSLLTTW
jgi:uncharacterized protein YqkB